MKRILLIGPRSFTIEEVETPGLGPGEALVRVQKVGICGPEIHSFRRGSPTEDGSGGPWTLGNECMGRIAAMGEGVSPTLIGKRVAVEPAIPCGHCV